MKHNIEFEEVLQRLHVWREEVVQVLRSTENPEQALKVKRQIDHALGCLKLCELHQIRPKAKVMALPDTQTKTPSSNYRIVEDQETEKRDHWIELKVDGERVKLYPGDIIIQEG